MGVLVSHEAIATGDIVIMIDDPSKLVSDILRPLPLHRHLKSYTPSQILLFPGHYIVLLEACPKRWRPLSDS